MPCNFSAPAAGFRRWSTALQSINQYYFTVRLKVDQGAGQLSLPHAGVTKTERVTELKRKNR